jgi:hypothetical protein
MAGKAGEKTPKQSPKDDKNSKVFIYSFTVS